MKERNYKKAYHLKLLMTSSGHKKTSQEIKDRTEKKLSMVNTYKQEDLLI